MTILNEQKTTNQPHFDLELVSEMLVESITDVLDFFGIEYQDGVRSISFACPIHDGKNPTGSSILKNDIGNWQCYTAQCHEQYGASILNFIQALLSKENNKPCSFIEAIEWSANFVGLKLSDQTPTDKERIDFIKLCKYINRKKQETPVFTPREKVKEFLAIPSSYYIKRNYSRAILEKFDIGYCHNENKAFFDRIVVPFYDDNGEYMVGCSSRSRYEQCPKCKLYHDLNVRCPITKQERLKCVKWRHSSLLKADNYLYNYWNAKSHIYDTNTIILVEGPGDVWRLEEAGIHNSVAILKTILSPGQRLVLELSGVINLIVATDMDEAGQKGANTILNDCKNLFNIQRVKYDANDIGSLSIEKTKQVFLPILEKL